MASNGGSGSWKVQSLVSHRVRTACMCTQKLCKLRWKQWNICAARQRDRDTRIETPAGLIGASGHKPPATGPQCPPRRSQAGRCELFRWCDPGAHAACTSHGPVAAGGFARWVFARWATGAVGEGDALLGPAVVRWQGADTARWPLGSPAGRAVATTCAGHQFNQNVFL